MRLSDALGLGPADGRTVVPVRTWLPLLAVAVLVATAILWTLDGESELTSFVVITVPLALVIPVAALVTLGRERRG